MSSPLPVRLTSLDAAGNGPDVEFTWLDDRFVHAVYFVSEGNCMLVAEQVVESPELGVALVELHPQLDASASPTLFLHGAGDGAQWSMSVEGAEDGTLRFDVAARVLRPPVERELVYRWHGVEAAIGSLEPYPTDWPRLVAGEGTVVEGPAADGRILIRMTETPASCPCTLRWQYEFTTSGG